MSVDAVVLGDIALVLIVGAALAAGCRRVGIPAVIGEILAGVVLGPSLFGHVPGHLSERLFPPDAVPYLTVVAQIGLMLFMFTAGWELDVRLVRGAGRSIPVIAFASLAVPFGLGLAVAPWLFARQSPTTGHPSGLVFAMYLGTAMAITAFPVLARLLSDQQLLGTRRGTIALVCAAAGDVVAWCLLVLITTAIGAPTPARFVRTLLLAAAYVLLMAVLVRPLFAVLFARMSGSFDSRVLVGLVAAGVLLSAELTSWIGIHPIFGAFTFGVVLPREPKAVLRLQVIEPLTRVGALLLPVYFIVTGLSVDLGGIGWAGALDLLVVLVVACVGKLVGVGVSARACGLGWVDALGLGVLMNTRGLTELVILSVGLQLGVIDSSLFTVMVLMALITTAATGPLLRLLPVGDPAVPASDDRQPASNRP